MKLAWTPSPRSASALALLPSMLLLGQNHTSSTQGHPPSKHNYEWKLAGVLPGHTTLRRAQDILGEPSFADSEKHSTTWAACKRTLEIETDSRGIVQIITVWRTSEEGQVLDCHNSAPRESKWVTSLGLGIGDSLDHVMRLYGQPNSRSPSTKGGQQLELLYYAFDWAGPDVPQVMEVLCTPEKDGKPGRVVEITLAAPSL